MAHSSALDEREHTQHRTAPAPELPLLHPGVTSDGFKLAFRNHPAGVAVITADPGSGPVGLTATSVVSVSVEPPILIFSLSALSSATPGITAAETIVVHLMTDQDVSMARLFATSGVDRFSDDSLWSPLTTGEPLFHGVKSWLRCRIIDRMEVGGSVIVAAQAIEASAVEPGPDSSPLVYHNRRWHRLDDHSLLA
ncbi:flavin reductase family protein [Arthrobacter sp. 2RAF6]|uniref:flavin reductase family protein n=1 Tax=Arthrobacter sp. 2RAF6 TaxID=3233002 RepID=UPI003F8FDE27